MESNEIRRVFLDFFAERGHTVVPSASLIPVDPSLLLTVAGMVPFKDYLLGNEPPPYPRAASCQRCIRTADIDVVGTTARHLTFFEMLGNFSFGDYFKERAIPWAYELVTEGWGLDPDRLWFTVHVGDDEAAEIWLEVVGVDPTRLQRRDRDNFWQMGVAGPAGPSSEIFFDRGPAHGPDGGPIVDEERFVEIWNLVFMQYVQDEPYHVVGDLPAKSIDTGAGLERVAMVLQGVDSAFETDVVRSIIAAAERATGARFGANERSDVSLRVLGDHGRAVTFLIADGVVPSNEGRGYILRRLLRRAVRHAFLLGSEEPIMPVLVEATVAAMGEAYPELHEHHDLVLEMAEREEARFLKTLRSGHQLLEQALEALEEGAVLPGETAFKLHDTYGFPVELTEEIARERGHELDRVEFETMMTRQRERARAAFRGGKDADAIEAYRTLLGGIDSTEFLGYEREDAEARILAIVREGDTVERAEEGQTVEVFLDRTPFYAESGGQVGDTGVLETVTGKVRVEDTQFALPGIHGHRGVVTAGYVQVGQETAARIDAVRRERIRKNHTGTHILHWALREVLGKHVQQAGSLVAPDRLRFDFSHFEALDPEAAWAVEELTNERIIENAKVTTLVTSKEEAERMGALAFFGDKYGERVRVVRAGDYSVEFCGGTHVPSTGQVGPLVLVSEGSVGANLRRVEALTGSRAYEYLSDIRRRLERTAEVLHTQPAKIVEATTNLLARLHDTEARLERFETEARTRLAASLLESLEEHDGHGLVVAELQDVNAEGLRSVVFQLRDRIPSGIVVLGADVDGKGALVVWVSDDLVERGISAGDIAAVGAKVLGGGGAKDPRLAQAGGPRGDEIQAALDAARRQAREALLDLG
ncbi:MAG TPA: alanine--tRNA ligase [Actinobacteria bacterium]|nr:alanine--tRNA ligase [Actinomycetota bacterium]